MSTKSVTEVITPFDQIVKVGQSYQYTTNDLIIRCFTVGEHPYHRTLIVYKDNCVQEIFENPTSRSYDDFVYACAELSSFKDEILENYRTGNIL